MTTVTTQPTHFPRLTALGMIPNGYRRSLDQSLNDAAGLMVERLTETIDETPIRLRIDAMLEDFDFQTLLDPSMLNAGGMEILTLIQSKLRRKVLSRYGAGSMATEGQTDYARSGPTACGHRGTAFLRGFSVGGAGGWPEPSAGGAREDLAGRSKTNHTIPNIAAHPALRRT